MKQQETSVGIYSRSPADDLEIRVKNAMFGEVSEAGRQMYSGPLWSFISTHTRLLGGLSRPDEFILIWPAHETFIEFLFDPLGIFDQVNLHSGQCVLGGGEGGGEGE